MLRRYSCTPGFCSQTNGLDRADVLGCMYFCYLDVTPDEQLFRDEFHTRYNEWLGGGMHEEEDAFIYVAVVEWLRSRPLDCEVRGSNPAQGRNLKTKISASSAPQRW